MQCGIFTVKVRIGKHFCWLLVFFFSWQVVEEYNKQLEEIQQLTEYLEEKKKELDNYKQNISQVITEIITSVWYQYIFIRIECISRNRE